MSWLDAFYLRSSSSIHFLNCRSRHPLSFLKPQFFPLDRFVHTYITGRITRSLLAIQEAVFFFFFFFFNSLSVRFVTSTYPQKVLEIWGKWQRWPGGTPRPLSVVLKQSSGISTWLLKVWLGVGQYCHHWGVVRIVGSQPQPKPLEW